MKCGIIFGGNSLNSKKIFTLQKKIVRLMADVKPRYSCGSLFKRLQILAQFKVALKRYLITHSFYSVDEFIMFTNKS
jgi:hypothetical protein